MAEAVIDSTDLVLLLLRAPTQSSALQDQMPGITRLEKLLFLLDREEDVDLGAVIQDPFEFRPHDFGPYSKEVYEAVEVLEAAGLLREELIYSGQSLEAIETRMAGIDDEPEGTERRFILTDSGEQVADLLAKKAPPDLVEQLSTVKNRFGTLPLRRLIHYVYTKYPDSAVHSKIRDQVLGD